MWPFKTEKLTENERLTTLEQRYAELTGRILALEVNEKVFRDQVLRKVQKAKTYSEEPEELNKQGGIIGYKHGKL